MIRTMYRNLNLRHKAIFDRFHFRLYVPVNKIRVGEIYKADRTTIPDWKPISENDDD